MSDRTNLQVKQHFHQIWNNNTNWTKFDDRKWPGSHRIGRVAGKFATLTCRSLPVLKVLLGLHPCSNLWEPVSWMLICVTLLSHCTQPTSSQLHAASVPAGLLTQDIALHGSYGPCGLISITMRTCEKQRVMLLKWGAFLWWPTSDACWNWVGSNAPLWSRLDELGSGPPFQPFFLWPLGFAAASCVHQLFFLA